MLCHSLSLSLTLLTYSFVVHLPFSVKLYECTGYLSPSPWLRYLTGPDNKNVDHLCKFQWVGNAPWKQSKQSKHKAQYDSADHSPTLAQHLLHGKCQAKTNHTHMGWLRLHHGFLATPSTEHAVRMPDQRDNQRLTLTQVREQMKRVTVDSPGSRRFARVLIYCWWIVGNSWQ